MRRLNIKFSQNSNEISLNIPAIGRELTWQQRFLEVVTYLRFGITTIYLASLPLALFVFEDRSSVGRESSLFAWMILASLMITSLYALEIVLASKQRVIDPPGSLAVLLFGLIVTSVSAFLVFTEFESPENTFGNVGESAVKSLSGLTIILVLYLFYILRLGITQAKSYSVFINALLFGYIAYLILGILDDGLVTNILYVLPALFISALAIRRNRNNKILYIGILGLALGIYHIFNYDWNDLEVFIYLLVSTISVLYVSYIVFSFQLDLVIVSIRSIPNEIRNLIKTVREVSPTNVYNIYSILLRLTIFCIPLLLAVTAIALISNESNLDFVTASWNSIIDSFKSIDGSISTLLTGKGASITTSSGSLLSSIIEGLGLAGLTAYLGIFTYAILNATKNLILISSKSSLSERIILLFILLSIPILGIFIYIPLLLIVVWWIVFSISLVDKKVSSSFVLNPEVRPLKIWRFRSRITESVRLIIMLTLFLICYILMYTVLDNLGNII